jgi:hypothetical protein
VIFSQGGGGTNTLPTPYGHVCVPGLIKIHKTSFSFSLKQQRKTTQSRHIIQFKMKLSILLLLVVTFTAVVLAQDEDDYLFRLGFRGQEGDDVTVPPKNINDDKVNVEEEDNIETTTEIPPSFEEFEPINSNIQ